MRVRNIVFAVIALALWTSSVGANPSQTKGAGSKSKAADLRPKITDSDLQQREAMIKISRQLGVTCNYCHDVSNFRSDKIPAFKTSQNHMKIVDILNMQGHLGSGVRADCYLCHRGKAMPEYKEVLK
jgi:hypothetical protein